MKTFNVFLSILIIIFLSSCTITQEFHFNKDFSGSYKSTIDMSEFMNAMKSLDTSNTGMADLQDSLSLIIEEVNQSLQNTGVKNIQAGWTENNKMYLKFDFDNIDVLNKALYESKLNTNEQQETNELFIFFEKKGKTLIYHGIAPADVSDEGKDLGAMKDYYKYKTIFTFDRKIKKSDNEKYKISEDRHRATLEAPLFDITKKEFNMKVKFKLK